MFNFSRATWCLCLGLALIWLLGAAHVLRAQTDYNGDSGSDGTPSAMIIVSKGQGSKYNIAIADLEPVKPRDRRIGTPLTILEPAKPRGRRTGTPLTILPYRLSTKLKMGGLLNLLAKRRFLETNRRAGIDPNSEVDFEPWKSIVTNFLIKGGMEVSDSKLMDKEAGDSSGQWEFTMGSMF